MVAQANFFVEKKKKKLGFSYNAKHQESTTLEIEKFADRNSLEALGMAHGRLDIDLCNVLCNMSNLKTLHLRYLKHVADNTLKQIASRLNLMEISIEYCDGVQYEDIPIVIESSPALETLRFADRSYNLVDEQNFTLMVKARKESGAGFPLKLLYGYKDEVSAHVKKLAANYVVLKTFFPDYYYESDPNAFSEL